MKAQEITPATMLDLTYTLAMHEVDAATRTCFDSCLILAAEDALADSGFDRESMGGFGSVDFVTDCWLDDPYLYLYAVTVWACGTPLTQHVAVRWEDVMFFYQADVQWTKAATALLSEHFAQEHGEVDVQIRRHASRPKADIVVLDCAGEHVWAANRVGRDIESLLEAIDKDHDDEFEED